MPANTLGIAGYQPNQQAQLQHESTWNAIRFGLELKKQQQQSTQFNELLKLKKMQAESDEDKAKFDRQIKTMSLQLKVLEMGGTILEKNPTMSQEDYMAQMEPALEVFSGSDQKKENIMEAVKAMQESFKPPTKSVMTESQAREAAISGEEIPKDTSIIAEDKMTAKDAETQMEAWEALNPRSIGGKWKDAFTFGPTEYEKKKLKKKQSVYSSFASQFPGGSSPATAALGDTSAQEFPNESAARAAGNKKGDIVTLLIDGVPTKVRLK